MAEYDIGQAFQKIENELIASMMRNMERHRAEETKYGFNWRAWQAEQLKALEQYKRDNKKKYKGQFSSINRQLRVLIQAARLGGGLEEEISMLKTMQKGYSFPFFPQRMLELIGRMEGKNFQEKVNLLVEGLKSKDAVQLDKDFFQLNNQKLDALIRATVKDFEKAETAMLRMADDQYRKIIFDAQVYANTGAGTYSQAVDMASKDFLRAGINCIEYKNGARHTIKDYAAMAIRTANKRAALMGAGEKRAEWGIHTVIVNNRAAPCEKCLPFVGVVFIDDVYSGGSRKDGDYPLLSTAIAAGLFHPNCKDGTSTYYPGITPIPSKYTKNELEKVMADARKESRQKYAAVQAEKYDRLFRHSLDSGNRSQYKNLSDKWKSMLHDSNMSKFTDMLQDFNNGQKDTISHWSIQKNMNKSDVGKKTVEYIIEHPELNICLCYKVDSPKELLGIQDGNDIYIYASKTATIQKTAETIIHEITHHKYNIGGSQWAECVCRAQELKHRIKTDKLTGQELRDIIKVVKKDYPELNWR